MRATLLGFLACPRRRCGLDQRASSTVDDNIHEGSLHCRDCRAEYPVRGGIPRFVPDAAYARSFSFEWRRWRRTQFDTAARNDSLATFTASTGHTPVDFAGKAVLEAGCGTGRYMDLLARAGAQIMGLDLSPAIEVTQENLGHLPTCHFVQGDLMRPPFRVQAFDFVYSIGVLHHTSSTRQSFRGLVPLLREGGEIAVWVHPLRRLSETFERFLDRVNQVLSVESNFTIPASRQATVQ
jgi:SAM-dependent methyltransferase